MRPYFGVSWFVLSALNKAFSEPKIWMVEAGCLAKLRRDPAWEMSLAPTSSPTRTVRLGAMATMRFLRYS